MKTRFVGYKVLDSTGAGYASHVLAAVEHATANRQTLGIKVINLSLGHSIMQPAKTDPLVRAVEGAVAAGIVVVVSAGNHGVNSATGLVGYGGVTVPGNAPSAITVGAIDINDTTTRIDDKVQAYSSRGPTWFDALPKPDLVAPGHRLVGTAAKAGSLYRDYADLRVTAQGGKSADYLRLSGTSMSAAVTSGIIAAGLGTYYHENHHGRLSPNAVKAILEYTAVPLPGEDVLSQGAGSLILWGDSVVWGNQILWGDSLVWSENALGVDTGHGVVFGFAINWGSVTPNQVQWMQPPEQDAAGQTLIGLMQRYD